MNETNKLTKKSTRPLRFSWTGAYQGMIIGGIFYLLAGHGLAVALTESDISRGSGVSLIIGGAIMFALLGGFMRGLFSKK